MPKTGLIHAAVLSTWIAHRSSGYLLPPVVDQRGSSRCRPWFPAAGSGIVAVGQRRTERLQDSTTCYWPRGSVHSSSFHTSTRQLRCRFASVSAAAADSSFPLDDDDVDDASTQHASTDTDDKEENSSSVVGATFSLMKTLVGTGMLALPSGLAVISDHPSMLWSANAMLLGLGILSAYTFWTLGRLADATGGQTLSDMWARVHPGSNARVVSVANLVYCVGLCLAYSLVLGDSLSALVQSAVGATTKLSTSWLLSRQSVIVSVTALLLWPLCNLKSLAALAPFSIAGVLSSLFVTMFVAYRCPALVPSSPYKAGGTLVKILSPSLQPQFGTYNRIFSAAPVVLIALGCVAWMGHFSGPEFFRSLGNSDSSAAKHGPSEKMPRSQMSKYSIMTVAGYSIVAILNAMVLSFGFLTFGGNAQGNVLNNYAVTDVGATVSRFLVSVSVASGYPFLFTAGRSSALSLFGGNGTNGDNNVTSQSRMSKLLMLLITCAALVVNDAGFVVSLIGAIAGTAIIYIFPPLLFLKQFGGMRGIRWRLERGFCRFLVGFGAVSAALGTFAAVMTTYFPRLLQ